MQDKAQSAPRPRRKLPCGAISCGGCVKECGVVVYRYIAGLDDEDERTGEPASTADLVVRNS